ncbi:ketosteroid isomerase family protein [Mycobacterium sp. 21AC1]|uniref:nuclear transport factor 2 family protein n=1 Tax=[Mycobacterium] appelbergii TaxID=2939269 RepID=UPI0029390518|nr:nuclear transport factor 2 family protein [Mycobacterium sp. 21AC1]MDV3126207.1 ketosteroid isomerase family protein [Mycobacterium sp. 21AC1]
MAMTRDELLAAVERSPQAAGAHDRDGWVGLFAAGGQIEDPVGSRPHRGAGEIARFYDTFIGPRNITFHRDVDIVDGTTVIRDLELEVAMGAAVTMRIPAYLRYALRPGQTGPEIAELQAYWQLPAMVGQFVRNGIGAAPAGMQLAGALLRNQGPGGAVGFAAGFRRAGRRGRQLCTRLFDDLCAGDEVAVRRALARDTAVHTGDHGPLGASELVELTAGARWRKPVVSGYSVVAGLDSAGHRAVLIADLTPKPLAISRLRYFADVG